MEIKPRSYFLVLTGSSETGRDGTRDYYYREGGACEDLSEDAVDELCRDSELLFIGHDAKVDREVFHPEAAVNDLSEKYG